MRYSADKSEPALPGEICITTDHHVKMLIYAAIEVLNIILSLGPV
jgi:hypothetical protein